MSDDLIERLDRLASLTDRVTTPLFVEILDRIRELESANCRLTKERDRLKSAADKYHEEVWVLRARLATAEADAMERAARVLSRASEEIRSLKPKAD